MARRAQSRELVRFERVEQQRAHEYVAEQIRRQIVLRLIPSGQALPPERELAAMFGVGRATVQQAMRILVEDNMVESRRGKGGGNFVRGPDESRAGMEGLLGRLRRQRERVQEALSYRRAVEPAAAALAAHARSPADLRALAFANSAASAAQGDVEFMQADTEFHLAVAEAARNRFFAEAIERIRLELNDAMIALPESDVWHERSALEHDAIIAAITDGDAGNAARVMQTHIAHTEQSVAALLAALARRG
jgi:GntR family transcriptional regulator, transcriptional repressor for pyruvate dehydrogenase complex